MSLMRSWSPYLLALGLPSLALAQDPVPTDLEPVSDWLLHGSFTVIGADASNADIDEDTATWDSSESELFLPTDATVVSAELAWVCRGVLDSTGRPNPEQVLLTAPGAPATPITGTLSGAWESGSIAQRKYRADVTEHVSTPGVYRVANVRCAANDAIVNYWHMWVVYEEPTLPLARIQQFDGFDYFQGESASVPLTGWVTDVAPLTRIGVISTSGHDSTEGGEDVLFDCTDCGDGLSIVTLSGDAENPVGNVFNNNARVFGEDLWMNPPRGSSDVGFDIDLFDTNALPGSNADFSVRYETGSDQIIMSSVMVGTTVREPFVDVVQVWETPDVVLLGDLGTYAIELTSSGPVEASEVVLTVDEGTALSGQRQVVLTEGPTALGPFPRVLTSQADSDPLTEQADGTLRLTLGTLDPTDTVRLTGEGTVDASITVDSEVTWVNPLTHIAGDSLARLDTGAVGPLRYPVCDDGLIELDETDADTDGIADACDDLDTDTDTDTDVDTDTDTDAGTEPDADTEPDTDADTEPDTDLDTTFVQGGSCGCTTGSRPMGLWGALFLGGLLLRRRRS